MDETGIEASNGIAQAPRRWAPDVIELAYQVWSGAAERNVLETCRQLKGLGCGNVPRVTLQQWRDREQWEQRRQLEHSDLAPVPSDLHVLRLQVAGPQAVSYLQSVMDGSIEPEPDRIKAASILEAAARSLILKQADLTKQDGRRKPVPAPASQPTPLHSMTDEQLAQEEQRRRQG
jgi:hypothetical protein